MNIAVIPARGGSKRIPRKNIRQFCGKPMIAWSIETALASRCFSTVLVSTDDPEIADCARRYGAEVPFVRPPELSDDHTGTIPVIAHAVGWFQQHRTACDAVCCLYATAPFVRSQDLREGLRMLRSAACQYAFSVTSYGFPVQRAVRLTEDQRVEMLHPELFAVRSQDLEEIYHDAGQFYWGLPQAWLSGIPIFSPQALAVPIPRHRVQDIDTPDDWRRAELMFRALVQDEGE